MTRLTNLATLPSQLGTSLSGVLRSFKSRQQEKMQEKLLHQSQEQKLITSIQHYTQYEKKVNGPNANPASKQIYQNLIEKAFQELGSQLETIVQNRISVQRVFKEPLLHIACNAPKGVNTNSIIRNSIALGFSCNDFDAQGYTPLDLAALQRDLNRVEFLIKESEYKARHTPKVIETLIQEGHQNRSKDDFIIATSLLRSVKGCQLNHYLAYFYATALDLACQNYGKESQLLQPLSLLVIKTLIIKFGITPSEDPLAHLNSKAGRCLSNSLVNAENVDGLNSTIWHLAAKRSDATLICFLCQYSRNNINKSDANGKTPIDYAVSAEPNGTYEQLYANGGQHRQMQVQVQFQSEVQLQSFPNIERSSMQSTQQFLQNVVQILSQWVIYFIEKILFALTALWSVLKKQAIGLAEMRLNHSSDSEKYLPSLFI